MVFGYTVKYSLPPDIYYIFGKSAYKYIPPNSKGSCTLACPTPTTFLLEHEKFPFEMTPNNMTLLRFLDMTYTKEQHLRVVSNQHTSIGLSNSRTRRPMPSRRPNLLSLYRLQVTAHIEKVKEARDTYLKKSLENQDHFWGDLAKNLSPADRFLGLGGWISRMLHVIGHILLICFAVYVLIRISLLAVNKCSPSSSSLY